MRILVISLDLFDKLMGQCSISVTISQMGKLSLREFFKGRCWVIAVFICLVPIKSLTSGDITYSRYVTIDRVHSVSIERS